MLGSAQCGRGLVGRGAARLSPACLVSALSLAAAPRSKVQGPRSKVQGGPNRTSRPCFSGQRGCFDAAAAEALPCFCPSTSAGPFDSAQQQHAAARQETAGSWQPARAGRQQQHAAAIPVARLQETPARLHDDRHQPGRPAWPWCWSTALDHSTAPLRTPHTAHSAATLDRLPVLPSASPSPSPSPRPVSSCSLGPIRRCVVSPSVRLYLHAASNVDRPLFCTRRRSLEHRNRPGATKAGHPELIFILRCCLRSLRAPAFLSPPRLRVARLADRLLSLGRVGLGERFSARPRCRLQIAPACCPRRSAAGPSAC